MLISGDEPTGAEKNEHLLKETWQARSQHCVGDLHVCYSMGIRKKCFLTSNSSLADGMRASWVEIHLKLKAGVTETQESSHCSLPLMAF